MQLLSLVVVLPSLMLSVQSFDSVLVEQLCLISQNAHLSAQLTWLFFGLCPSESFWQLLLFITFFALRLQHS